MMKKFILLILLIACLMHIGDMTAKWNSILTVQGIEMRLIVGRSGAASNYSAQMDSLDKKAFRIPAGATSIRNSIFNIVITNLDFRSVLKEIAGWVLKQTN
jgi:uncharacterized protein